jgi:hypothetical protein
LVGWREGDGGGHVAGWTGGWLGLPITIGSPRLPIYILYIYTHTHTFLEIQGICNSTISMHFQADLSG